MVGNIHNINVTMLKGTMAIDDGEDGHTSLLRIKMIMITSLLMMKMVTITSMPTMVLLMTIM